VIGNHVRIHSRVFVAEFVEIKDDAWIGPGVTILNVPHPPCPSWEECASGDRRVIIGQGAKVGGGAVIGPWTKVGAGSLIGAGSVVIRDVPEGVVAVGNPARVLRKVSKLECELGVYKVPYEWEVGT
jgi:acetyltransferase-like isoleucine patch superfamily enzyme